MNVPILLRIGAKSEAGKLGSGFYFCACFFSFNFVPSIGFSGLLIGIAVGVLGGEEVEGTCEEAL